MSRNKGILFVAIDHTRPLSEQGPFDIVLHKVNRLYSVPISSIDFILLFHYWHFVSGFSLHFPFINTNFPHIDAVIWKRVATCSWGWWAEHYSVFKFSNKAIASFVSMRKRLSSFHTYITSSINDIGHAFTDCWAACYHVAWKLIPVRHNLQRNALSPVMSHDLNIEVEASSSVWGSFSFMGTFTWVTGFH